MNYKKNYTFLLENLCYEYQMMLKILDEIDELDRLLDKISNERRPDADFVYSIAEQKERLIEQLDEISRTSERLHVQLENIMALCQEIDSLPLYKYMENLQLLTFYRINGIMNTEAEQTPQILNKLTACKESMELDLMLSEVPDTQKQLFWFIPDAKRT